MTYLLFATALGLSACAAYYSVMGLIAIFASAVVPIFIMGSLLEASKLVVASWLYRNWKEVPVLLKSYFTVALIILMMLTSMGIFGYLSKAHLDQAIPTGDVAAKLALIDEKIKTEKENINASRKELSQLDSQVDQTISRTTDANGTDRAIAIRRGQQKDRARILNEIGQAQAKVAKLNEERAPIASEVRKVEAEVGPIKYIAALIYGDNPESDVLEKAVRWVIILIVSVFDPLAVLLLIAANWQQKRDRTKVIPVEADTVVEEPADINLTLADVVETEEAYSVKREEEQPEHETVEEVKSDTEEGDLDINIEEPNKDWEPNLYNRRALGRYLEETTPEKTKSFLQKVADSFKPKSIETEVEELQDKNTK